MSDLIAWHAPWSGRLLVLIVSLVGIALVAWSFRQPRGVREPCRRCGYERFGSSAERCPECGHARGARTLRSYLPWRGWLCAVGLAVAIALPSFVVQRRVRQFGWDYYLTLEPLYSLDPYKTVMRESIGGVEFRVELDRRSRFAFGPQRTIVRDRDGSRALSEIDEDGLSVVSITPAELEPGREFAVISMWSGGAHCCATIWIVRIEAGRASVLTKVETRNSQVLVDDVDHDGVGELTLFDDTFAYWRTSYAGSPRPLVTLCLIDGELYFADNMMRRMIPSEIDRAAAIRQAFGATPEIGNVPEDVWADALDWIYAGHGAEAIETLESAWPAERDDRDEFMRDFLSHLATSQWRSDLERLNGEDFAARLDAATREAHALRAEGASR